MSPNDTRATLFALFTVVAAIGVPLPTHAQPQPSLGETGACPPNDTLFRLNPSLDDGSIRSLQNRMGTPVRPDLPLYRNPTLTDPKVQTKALGYDDDIEVLLPAGAVIGQNGPVLVKRM